MNCPRCQTDNLPDARYCLNCGAALALRCSNCQAELTPGARFCMYCGQAIRTQTPADDARLQRLAAAAPSSLKDKVRAAAHLRGEQRHVTVLFLDVVGSTALSGKLGVERWSVVINGFFDRVAPVIYRYEGTIAHMVGDALVAFFGAPVAHEDDPLRAVLAALDVLEVARGYADLVRAQDGVEFAVRTCLNHGLVVLGDVEQGLKFKFSEVGGVVNLAARMKFAARPNTVLLAESVYRFVAPLFDCLDLGFIEVKGRPEPVRVYEVTGRRAEPGSLRGVVGLSSPMVGREVELERLMHLCEAVRAGLGRAVLVIGEPGMGKSRLIAEWQAAVVSRAESLAVQWAEAHSHSYAHGLVYHLAAHLALALLGVEEGCGEMEIHTALKALVADLLGDPQKEPGLEVYAPLAHLLSLKTEGAALRSMEMVETEALQLRYTSAMRRLIEKLAERRPVVLVLEDLHWADPSSVELLTRLLPLVYTAPVLFCFAIRLDREAPGWRLVSAARELLGNSLAEVTLGALSDEQSRILVANLLSIEALPDEMRVLILKKAEGNPYYVEEIIRMLIERGAIVPAAGGWTAGADLRNVVIPDNLQGLLMARIDRLPDESRRTLRVASVVGRQFPVRVLEQVLGEKAAERMGAIGVLSSLENAGMVRVARLEPELEYLFQHALVQEAAYASLLSNDRKQLHLAVGRAVERLYPDRLQENAAILARHYSEAGKGKQALHYYILAGKAGIDCYCNQESEEHFRRALELGPSTNQRGELLAGLGVVVSRQGRMQEAIHIWKEAIHLYRSAGDANSVARLYARAARAAWHGGDTPMGLQLCLEGLEAIQGAAESAETARLMHETARAYYFNGMPDQAAPLCRQALEIAERLGAVDVRADTLATMGILPQMPADEAIAALQQAVELSESNQLTRVAHRAHMNLAAMLWGLRGDTLTAHQHYQRTVEIARRRGVPQEFVLSKCTLLNASMTLGEFGEVEQGIVEVEGMLKDLDNPEGALAEIKMLKANLLGFRGDWLAALELTRQGQAEVRRLGNLQMLYYSSEFLGQMLLETHRFIAPQDLSEAESAIQETITIGDQGIGSKVASRCRLSVLRTLQGRLPEAHAVLESGRQAVVPRLSIWDELTIRNAEAELASAEERWEDAISSFEAVVDINARTNERWYWARALLDLAGVHILRGEAEDLARAQALYNLSLDLFRKMGALAYTRVIETRLLELQLETESQVIAAKKVSQEMVRAGRIQSSFLPEAVPQPAGWELAVTLEPVLQTSGDFYDFIPMPDERLGIVVADVTDKGPGAALFMASCRTLIRTYAEVYPSQPEQVLAAVNRRLLLDTHSGLYITVFYGVLDPALGRLVYCNAGHNPPYLFRAPDGETVQSLPATGMAIGIMPEARWTQREVQLEPQDVLILFTDGVTEAQDERQALYGEGRLLEAGRSSLAVSSEQKRRAEVVLASVLGDIRRFVGSAPRSDDLTLMVIQRDS
jgi:serine phosphatase RsbU (regulator of sigma subunit)/class 3 adenylate cyclase